MVCGGLWWFAVVCGGLRLFVMVCGGLSYSHTPYRRDQQLIMSHPKDRQCGVNELAQCTDTSFEAATFTLGSGWDPKQ